MAVPRLAESDVYEMYAVHDAFRRDLTRLIAIATAGQVGHQTVVAGWANFTWQLFVHHTVEDSDLWPRLRRAASVRPADLAMLEEMEAEHAEIAPLLAAVDAALYGEPDDGQNGELADRAATLAVALTRHFRHEEESAIPLMRDALSPAELRGFKAAMARRQGLSGAATFIPWIIDDVDDAARRRFLAAMPALARLANWLYWERRYRRRGLWTEIIPPGNRAGIPMSVRKRIARFNKMFANRVIGGPLSRLPGFGLICHHGRKSGRAYRTPVKVFMSGQTYLISLPYGADSDWVRNVLAADGCDLIIGRRRIRLVAPKVRVDPAPAELPGFIRFLQRKLGITEHLTLEPAGALQRSSAQPPQPAPG